MAASSAITSFADFDTTLLPAPCQYTRAFDNLSLSALIANGKFSSSVNCGSFRSRGINFTVEVYTARASEG